MRLAAGTERRQGWEGRLAQVMEAARARPYELGVHDCFRLACLAVEALTGSDLWAGFAGRYRTRREALRLIARHGASFDAAFSWLFGGALDDARQARRGDIVKLIDAHGWCHLGLCNGAEVAWPLEHGLGFAARGAAVGCWRVG